MYTRQLRDAAGTWSGIGYELVKCCAGHGLDAMMRGEMAMPQWTGKQDPIGGCECDTGRHSRRTVSQNG
jgi:hypothetical protein